MLLKFLVGVIILIVIIRIVDLKAIIESFRKPDYPLFLYLAVILLPVNLFLQWYRWHFLLDVARAGSRKRDSWLGLLAGMTLGFVTPARLGEAGRIFFVSQERRLPVLGMLVIDKLYAFFCLFIGGVWGVNVMLLRKFEFTPYLSIPLIAVSLLLCAAALLLGLHPQWTRSAIYNFSLLFPFRDKIKGITNGLDYFRPEKAVPFFLYSFLLYVVYITQFCFLARGFQPLSLEAALSATTSTILTKTLLPVSLADLGIREGASVFFFHQYGIEKVTAFNSAMLLFAVNVLVPALAGLLALPSMGHWKKQGESLTAGAHESGSVSY